MNILYLHTHDTGRFIQPYGCGLSTPNLQRLAEDGTLFRQAYCTGPTCSPSRAGLLTGKMPHSNGMWGLAHRGFSLFRPEEHLAAWLGGHGYETALCGIQHEAEDPLTLGYQQILGDPHYSMGKCRKNWTEFDLGNAAAAAGFLAAPHPKPFFLSVGLFNTHRPFLEAGPEDGRYVQPPPQICDTPETRRDMAAFIRSLSVADQAAGIVLDALADSGCAENTVVLFTTDHGLAFPDMKCTLYDSGIGVSMILRYPGNPMAGKTCDALVSQLDVYPTLCELAGVPEPEDLQGVSLLPLLTGAQASVREAVFSEINFHVAYEPSRCVRTQRFKYIRRYSGYRFPMPSNCDDSPAKTQRMEAGFYAMPQPREQLFDLVCDPLERVDLSERPEFAAERARCAGLLQAWMERTRDPLLKGTMIPPDAALVNYPDSPSPAEKVFIRDFSKLI